MEWDIVPVGMSFREEWVKVIRFVLKKGWEQASTMFQGYPYVPDSFEVVPRIYALNYEECSPLDTSLLEKKKKWRDLIRVEIEDCTITKITLDYYEKLKYSVRSYSPEFKYKEYKLDEIVESVLDKVRPNRHVHRKPREKKGLEKWIRR